MEWDTSLPSSLYQPLFRQKTAELIISVRSNLIYKLQEEAIPVPDDMLSAKPTVNRNNQLTVLLQTVGLPITGYLLFIITQWKIFCSAYRSCSFMAGWNLTSISRPSSLTEMVPSWAMIICRTIRCPIRCTSPSGICPPFKKRQMADGMPPFLITVKGLGYRMNRWKAWWGFISILWGLRIFFTDNILFTDLYS